MEIRNREEQEPFTTKDGSTIRSLLDLSNAPVKQQSLAEASLPVGGSTERHYHKVSEELYYLMEGRGVMEIDGKEVGRGVGADILGHPLNALAWLAEHRAALGLPLRAGEFVMLGSVVKTVHFEAPASVRISFEGLGEASVRFTA